MGYQSDNLLEDERLSSFAGAVLSPVNYSRPQVESLLKRFSGRPGFETILDPQLYVPTSLQGQLRTWSYFPSDVESADLTSPDWWGAVTGSLAEVSAQLRASAVCSPAVVPRVFSPEYFKLTVEVGDVLKSQLSGTGVSTLQTLVVGLADLTQAERPFEVASIASRTSAEQIYLVLVGDTEPRRELNQVEELKGALRLIASLEGAGIGVLVSHCSSDILLWKEAGASSCATGKFFNLRRFTRSRYEEPAQGGGQLPYIIEESLVAFLRESDITRIRDAGLLSVTTLANPFTQEILQQLVEAPGRPWVGLGWRQFMYWFAAAEARIDRGELDVSDLLCRAEQLWRELADRKPQIFMEEVRNDGAWLRAWRRALAEFRY